MPKDQKESRLASLKTLRAGKIIELFDAALAEVYKNIDDPNTEAENARSITLKVTFKPNEERKRVAVTAKVTPKLCGAKEQGTMLYLGMVDGVVQATESDPDQPGLFDEEDEKEQVGPTRVATFKKGKSAEA